MEIQKINSAISTEISTKKEQTQTPIQADKNERTEIPTQKTVSDDWQLMSRSQPELQQLDEVDQTKIDELRQSLKTGTFKLDLDAISEAMLQQHG
ncbi:flagellar biosynthesis anti-sigma factor FlgM [Shewanella eurypsychrophilus]|uniref:Negative regulator of flagellin synthesis n=1 Tax=Shewanella eurypsychrophilus TaxID=2593656 RepID=A0ABX6V256_9GAMM|nr:MULTISPECIES: flagellar biosynthesis anti-sigma factor FlgM [Shewanella]QFU20481.1 flagellar biosynthesis anti-sigma factor FlgM [Shewanella sp. YLB-09]QFU20762.1 flagellar biosynthesis anti-sigma factor FlgM [Shewanella sp. YLB-09]QPG56058.1 flagellar biosynthesis anti-sigma factor FlgM [Shewanella eurypsychrophilus]